MGWVANVFILSGIVAIAYKRRFGFILGTIGNTLWGIVGYSTGQFDLLAIEAIIVVLQSFSWWKWGRA
jgi:hypothetical protein